METGCPPVVYKGLELVKVDVAFEGEVYVGVMGFVDDDVSERRAVGFLVVAGGCEVHVAGYVRAGLYEEGGQDVLRAAALVGRHHVLEAVILLDGFLKVRPVL